VLRAALLAALVVATSPEESAGTGTCRPSRADITSKYIFHTLLKWMSKNAESDSDFKSFKKS
jgi:hypothetical protein